MFKDVKSIAAHVKGVDHKAKDKHTEEPCIELRRIIKASGKERNFEPDNTDDGQPDAHNDNLDDHRLADDALVSAARFIPHIPA